VIKISILPLKGQGDAPPPHFGRGTPMILPHSKWRNIVPELLRALPHFWHHTNSFKAENALKSFAGISAGALSHNPLTTFPRPASRPERGQDSTLTPLFVTQSWILIHAAGGEVGKQGRSQEFDLGGYKC